MWYCDAMHSRRRFLLAGSTLLVSGCGFQLRGAPHLAFQKVYLSGALDPGLDREIRTTLTRDAGVTLVSRPEQADVVVYVSPLVKDKQILTLNAQGTVSQFTLISRLKFRATDGSGEELLPPSDVNISRLFNYNDVQILAKQYEEQLMYRDMQHDLVQQMLRRLEVLKPKSAATP